MQNSRAITTIVVMILAAAATRLVPHWWNFTAVGAMCLFGGAYFHRRWLAFVVPLTALLISDVLLTAVVYGPQGHGFYWFKYVCFALTVPLGMLLRERVTVARTAVVTVIATGMFFLLSNFHVWLGGDGVTYPHTPAGLVACYVAAIPFALNMLYGNLFYVGILFGGMELLKRQWPAVVGLAAEPARVRIAA
jgi:hypothetical protein